MTGIIREISYGFTSGTFTVKATCTNQDFAARVDHVTTVILTDLARTIDGINEQAAANTFGMHTTSNTVTVESGDASMSLILEMSCAAPTKAHVQWLGILLLTTAEAHMRHIMGETSTASTSALQQLTDTLGLPAEMTEVDGLMLADLLGAELEDMYASGDTRPNDHGDRI